MYVCGPTVYNHMHIGNARPVIFFDTVRRYLEYKGYQVTYIQNFTDVDDKIIKVAQEEGITAEEVANTYIKAYFDVAKALNVREADYHPRVTETMDGDHSLYPTADRAGVGLRDGWGCVLPDESL